MPSGPANDEFAAAEELSGVADTDTGTNVNATGEPGRAGSVRAQRRDRCGTAGPPRPRVPSPRPDRFVVRHPGGRLHGSRVDALTRIVGQRSKQLSFRAQEGDDLLVSGRRLLRDRRINLALALTPAPSNDAFADAAELSGNSASTAGTTVGATRESGEPSHGGTGYASVSYAWSAPRGGLLRLDARGTGFTPLVGVHTGDRVNGLTPQTTTGSGTLTIRVRAGTTYRIAVDGATSGAFPGSTISTRPPRPTTISRTRPF